MTDLFCSKGINLHLWWFLSQSNWKFRFLMTILTCFIHFLRKATNNDSSNPSRNRSAILCITLYYTYCRNLRSDYFRLNPVKQILIKKKKKNHLQSDNTHFWVELKLINSIIHRIKTIPMQMHKKFSNLQTCLGTGFIESLTYLVIRNAKREQNRMFVQILYPVINNRSFSARIFRFLMWC